MEATAIVIRYINTGMVVNIPAIIDRGTFDFRNRAVNFDDGFIFMRADGGITGPMFEHPSGGAEVGQRMQVRRVSGRLADTTREKQHDQQQMAVKDKLAFRVHFANLR